MADVAVEVKAPEDGDSGALAVPVFEEDGATLSEGLDEALRDRLTRLAGEGELKGERGETLRLHTDGEVALGRGVAAGLGKREVVDEGALRTGEGAFVARQ